MRHASANRSLPAPTLLRFTALAAFLIAVCAAMGITAAGAKAETVGFTFDRGVINLGGEEDGLWAKLVDPDIGDAPATINSDVAEDGTLTAPKEDFFFPEKKIEALETGNPSLPVVDAKIAIKAEDTLTGTYDADTGDASIVLPADVLITVYSAGSPSSVAKCRVHGFDLTMATTGSISDPGDPTADPPRSAATYDAAPFTGDPKMGSVIAPWTGLPASEQEGGSLASIVCPALDDMLGGPGAIWLTGKAGGEVQHPAPSKAPKLTGTPATSTEQTSAEFKFEAGEGETSPVTGFECKLDAGAFAACDSGTQSYSGLAVGAHKFTVRAKNETGAGPESTYDWTITEAQTCPDGTTGTPPNCVKPGKAKLGALKIQPKNKAVKRGKKVTTKVKVKNAGTAAAKGVKVCVNAPKKLVKVKKCVNLGQIAAGKTKTAKFKVKAKRKRGKATLKFKATSKNAGNKSGKATVKVK